MATVLRWSVRTEPAARRLVLRLDPAGAVAEPRRPRGHDGSGRHGALLARGGLRLLHRGELAYDRKRQGRQDHAADWRSREVRRAVRHHRSTLEHLVRRKRATYGRRSLPVLYGTGPYVHDVAPCAQSVACRRDLHGEVL